MTLENPFPLSQAGHDCTTVTVSALQGDRALQSRLLSLGFTPGTKVCLCSPPSPCGCRRVIIRNSPLVLDGAASEAILCSRCSEELWVHQDSKACHCKKKRCFGGRWMHHRKTT